MQSISQVVLIAITLVAIVLPCAGVAPAGASSRAGTLDRDADPIIITGAAMPGLVGAPLNQLFVYAFREGQW